MSDEIWAERGWMMFSSSGTTGAPRVFRYSHIDRELWAWANARALQSMDFRQGDTVFMITGYGPHVWAWGVQYALAKMGLPTLPGGGMDARARANIVIRYQPTILLCTPSYALHLGRIVQALGVEPRTTAVRTLFVAGEPGMSVAATRERIQELWGARLVEFYGCTEASPHSAVSRVRIPSRQADRSQRACSRTCRFGKPSIRNRASISATASAGSRSAPISTQNPRRSFVFWSATTRRSTARAVAAAGRTSAPSVPLPDAPTT